jgi:hypothetical protein
MTMSNTNTLNEFDLNLPRTRKTLALCRMLWAEIVSNLKYASLHAAVTRRSHHRRPPPQCQPVVRFPDATRKAEWALQG